MFFFCLTTKTYLSPQLLVYLPIDVPAQDPACSFLYLNSDYPLRHVHSCTCSSVYLFSLFLFGITSTITFQLICWGTYTQIYLKINLPVCLHAFLLFNHKDLPQIYPKINLSVYLHAYLLFNHKDLPVTSATNLCTCPYSYPFITLPVHFDYFIPADHFY